MIIQRFIVIIHVFVMVTAALQLTCDNITEPHVVITNRTSVLPADKYVILNALSSTPDNPKILELDLPDLNGLGGVANYLEMFQSGSTLMIAPRGATKAVLHNLENGQTTDKFNTPNVYIDAYDSFFNIRLDQYIFFESTQVYRQPGLHKYNKDNDTLEWASAEFGWNKHNAKQYPVILNIKRNACVVGPRDSRSKTGRIHCYNATSNDWEESFFNLPDISLRQRKRHVAVYNDNLYVCRQTLKIYKDSCVVYDLTSGNITEGPYQIPATWGNIIRTVETNTAIYLLGISGGETELNRCKIKNCTATATLICKECKFAGEINSCSTDGRTTSVTDTTVQVTTEGSTPVTDKTTTSNPETTNITNKTGSTSNATSSSSTRPNNHNNNFKTERDNEMITKYGSRCYQEDRFFKIIDNGIESGKYNNINDALDKIFPTSKENYETDKPYLTSKQAGFIAFTCFTMYTVTATIDLVKYLYRFGIFGKIVRYFRP